MFSSSSLSFLLLLFYLFFFFSLRSSAAQFDDDSMKIRLPIDRDSSPCVARSAPISCPVTCFRPDPVCGVDGVTYWCGCTDAHCSGAQVAKLGFCEVGNGGNGAFSGQALLLIHIVWLIVLGFSVLFGLF